MTTFDFRERLAFSLGANGDSDMEIIRRVHHGTISVVKADLPDDKSGIDYVATLKGGVEVRWDAKRRDAGCSRHWEQGPELALERWSDIRRKPGWTWDICKQADYILFTFDPADHGLAYAVPFQYLRTAFFQHARKWSALYRVADQNNGSWISQCVFVPVWEVLAAVNEQMAVPA